MYCNLEKRLEDYLKQCSIILSELHVRDLRIDKASPSSNRNGSTLGAHLPFDSGRNEVNLQATHDGALLIAHTIALHIRGLCVGNGGTSRLDWVVRCSKGQRQPRISPPCVVPWVLTFPIGARKRCVLSVPCKERSRTVPAE